MKVYNKPKSNQPQEKLFQEYILKGHPGAQHINETHKLSIEEFNNPFIDIRKIEKLLQKDNYLPYEKKVLVLSIIKQLPDKVRVAKNNNLVSVDFLIIDKKEMKHYIEFHEQQHRKLTDKRPKPIYDKDYNRFEIPRFVQRILKDIWRYENLPNYKIVWFDWFESNRNNTFTNLIDSEKTEFAMDGQFTFTQLCQGNIT